MEIRIDNWEYNGTCLWKDLPVLARHLDHGDFVRLLKPFLDRGNLQTWYEGFCAYQKCLESGVKVVYIFIQEEESYVWIGDSLQEIKDKLISLGKRQAESITKKNKEHECPDSEFLAVEKEPGCELSYKFLG